MTWITRFKMLPLLVLVASLSFGIRFGEFMTGVSASPGTANAQAEAQQVEGGEISELEEPPSAPSLNNEDEPRTAGLPDRIETDSSKWRDASEADIEFSDVRMELFEDLKKRRATLDEQARELAVREALLKAAQQEIDQKYQELVSLRSEIETLLKQQSDEEKARVASLVKIYEGMKPKDAARIFNTLDMDVLLNVVGRMSERKSAPIIASMDPARARNLTIMLMEQKALPDLVGDIN
jgi:flagellar motility protein MotE (MotC chaperone)